MNTQGLLEKGAQNIQRWRKKQTNSTQLVKASTNSSRWQVSKLLSRKVTTEQVSEFQARQFHRAANQASKPVSCECVGSQANKWVEKTSPHQTSRIEGSQKEQLAIKDDPQSKHIIIVTSLLTSRQASSHVCPQNSPSVFPAHANIPGTGCFDNGSLHQWVPCMEYVDSKLHWQKNPRPRCTSGQSVGSKYDLKFKWGEKWDEDNISRHKPCPPPHWSCDVAWDLGIPSCSFSPCRRCCAHDRSAWASAG